MSLILRDCQNHAIQYQSQISSLTSQISSLDDIVLNREKYLSSVEKEIIEAEDILLQKQQEILAADSTNTKRPQTLLQKQLRKKTGLLYGKNSNDSLTDTKGSSESVKSVESLKVPTSKSLHLQPFHKFIAHSYISPKKCDQCAESMWGKEMRCESCGFHIHSKCIANLNGPCMLKKLARSNFTAYADLGSYPSNEEGVNCFVFQCIEAITAKGIKAEGIYRKSGQTSQVNKIISAVYRGEPIDFYDPLCHFDLSAITSALKQFIRELAEPLITFGVYKDILDVSMFSLIRNHSSRRQS